MFSWWFGQQSVKVWVGFELMILSVSNTLYSDISRCWDSCLERSWVFRLSYTELLVHLIPYHIYSKTRTSPFHYLLMYLIYSWTSSKQCILCSEAAFCGICGTWSRSALFALAFLPHNLGLLRYKYTWSRAFPNHCVFRPTYILCCSSP